MGDSDKRGKSKRPAPPPPEHEYVVTWNSARRSWDVHLNGVGTGTFAYDKDTAIGLAVRRAQKDRENGIMAIVRSKRENEQTKVEWSP